ncbi:MAG: transposase [Chloroflexota bacterium]|nr:transposase [Chloroflexota bacterium]
MLDDLDLSSIADDRMRELVVRLLNIIETVTADLRTAQAENQRLRDAIARLKGEQGQPPIKPNTPSAPAPDHSSERERHRPAERVKQGKRDQIVIDRTEPLAVDPAILPPDAQFKGYEEVVVQDVVIRTDNVLFRKEKWYAPSTGQTYLAPLPAGYHGAFGPGIQALVLVFSFASQMTQPKITDWFTHVGIRISTGQISNLLIKDQERFHTEKDAISQAGLRSSPWQHLDDTSTRVNGQNRHCQVVTNPLHTTFITTQSKDRLTIVDVLRNGAPRTFRLNDEAFGYLAQAGVAQITRAKLRHLPRDQTVDATTFQSWLTSALPNLGDQTRKWIMDAAAVAAYHAQTAWPIVRLLICDGALQFTWVTKALALCWVHEGRHYKKLIPTVARHRQLLEDFLDDFWAYYDDLLAYRAQPTAGARQRLDAAFDTLFGQKTGYWALDERIALSRAKKTSLLLVLDHPEILLHNNPAELGARQRVRKRAISFGPRTQEGAKAWDTFMSLAATTKQLGVSFYQYIHDRISGTNQIPPLNEVIDERAKELDLGASWARS